MAKDQDTASFDISRALDEVSNAMNMHPVNIRRDVSLENCVSTGSLAIDLSIGGGVPAGRVIGIQGKEASGKTTLMYSITGESVRCNTLAVFQDYEGATDPEWMSRSSKVDLTAAMGEFLRNEKTNKGKWISTPTLRYFIPDDGADGFEYIKRTLKKIPDKRLVGNQWQLVQTTGKEKKKEHFQVTDNGMAQILFMIDSLAAMSTEADEEDKNPMAASARMFSIGFRKIKSKLAKKKCTLVFVNQLRERPGVNFGNPEYAPGGMAPRFFSDIIIELRHISVPGGKGPVEEEDCWDGEGTDRYNYSKVVIKKNKLFSASKNTMIRIWSESKGEKGYGIDPFYDTIEYLKLTNQIIPKSGRWTFNFVSDHPLNGKVFKWKQLKRLILDPDKFRLLMEFDIVLPGVKKKELAKILKSGKPTKEIKKALKLLDVREFCFKQMRSGEAFKIYSAVNRRAKQEVDEGETDE